MEYENVFLQSTLNLNKGIKSGCKLSRVASLTDAGAFLHGDNNTSFDGFLLDE